MKGILLILVVMFFSCSKDEEVLFTRDVQIYSQHPVNHYEIYSAGKLVKKNNRPLPTSTNPSGYKYIYMTSYETFAHDRDMIKVHVPESAYYFRIRVRGEEFTLKDFKREDGYYIIEY